MAHRFDDVAGAGLALGADHRRAFGDAPQRLAQVARAADKGHGELVLVDVVFFIRGGEHFALVDVVDAQRLQNLRLDKVADARLGHHRDGDRGNNALDHLRVAHARHAAVAADVGGHPFQRHHRAGACFFGDARLFRRDDIHDHAAFEHLRQSCFHRQGAGEFIVMAQAMLCSIVVCHLVLPCSYNPTHMPDQLQYQIERRLSIWLMSIL